MTTVLNRENQTSRTVVSGHIQIEVLIKAVSVQECVSMAYAQKLLCIYLNISMVQGLQDLSYIV